MGMTTESTIPDPRGTDHERALFLDLLWDDAIDAQVKRRAEAEMDELRSKLIAEMDDRRARNLKLDIAEVEGRKQNFESEGFYRGLIFGVFGALLFALFVVLATHHH
jgi:hypothetical protein